MTFDTDMTVVDAYTGQPTRVVLAATPKGVFLSAPDAVTPRKFYASMDEARAVLGQELVCAYTGERLHPVEADGMTMFAGGFDPVKPRPRHEFLRLARMRPGMPSAPAGPLPRVEPAREEVPMSLSREKPVTQEAVDTMLELTEGPRRKSRRKR